MRMDMTNVSEIHGLSYFCGRPAVIAQAGQQPQMPVQKCGRPSSNCGFWSMRLDRYRRLMYRVR